MLLTNKYPINELSFYFIVHLIMHEHIRDSVNVIF